MIEVAIQAAPFQTGELLERLGRLGGGGIASFTGVVRGDGGLVELFLDHYPSVTERALATLAEEAEGRWSLIAVTIVHRVGALRPGDPIVLVATAARHRAAAIEACAALIDRLKTEAPFWKRERFADGRVNWVEPRAGDDAAAARWRPSGLPLGPAV